MRPGSFQSQEVSAYLEMVPRRLVFLRRYGDITCSQIDPKQETPNSNGRASYQQTTASCWPTLAILSTVLSSSSMLNSVGPFLNSLTIIPTTHLISQPGSLKLTSCSASMWLTWKLCTCDLD